MTLTHTHTYVELEISEAAYKEIRAKLIAADYFHCFEVRDKGEQGTGPIDLTGIAVIPKIAQVEEKGPPCAYVYPGGAVCGYQAGDCMHHNSASPKVPLAGRHGFIAAEDGNG